MSTNFIITRENLGAIFLEGCDISKVDDKTAGHIAGHSF
jgi:hypothetical protein